MSDKESEKQGRVWGSGATGQVTHGCGGGQMGEVKKKKMRRHEERVVLREGQIQVKGKIYILNMPWLMHSYC